MKKRAIATLLIIATLFTTACGQIGSLAEDVDSVSDLPADTVMTTTMYITPLTTWTLS